MFAGSTYARELTRLVQHALVVLMFVTGLANHSVHGEPISWMEDFALAANRETKLAELIPGTDDYYFYHCLHYQTTGQLERSEAMLRDWLAEHQGRETPSITAMTDRQRLLTYQQSPQRTIDHLVTRLGIKLDHAPPATKNERRFPSQLDQAMLQSDRLVKEALQRNDTLKPLGIQFLAELFRQGNPAGVSISLRELLDRVDGPYVADLDQLVSKELQLRRPNEQRFGDVRAHAFLTLDELEAVAAALPAIAINDQFVAAKLRRMRPSADDDLSQQPDVRLDYLQRLEAYLRSLPASYSSMQAAAAFRLLEANLARGVFDRDLFMRYLRLPRVSPIVPLEWVRQSGQSVNLNDNFMDLAILPPIGNEEPVVRKHLEHFLRDAEDVDAFSEVLKSDYLRTVFAETKLLYGVGPEDQWYKMLSAAQRQSLRDAVQIRLADENPTQFDPGQVSELLVDVKNVQELVVRIYEINTPSYYRSHNQPIDTDMDLDGLLATHERILTYSQPAVQRHRERIDFPEMEGRGVWVVDLVGKGIRARALIRRGAIETVQNENADGMVFTVIDENRRPIPTATMWVGSREFVADDRGRIVLPPVAEPVNRRAIVSDGRLANQVSFRHLQEAYRLAAGMHLDRAQLQSGGETELLIRPQLFLGSTPIAVKTLTDVSVTLSAVDLDGLSTTSQIDGQELNQNGELVVPMRVPARLSNLSATLTGTLAGLADGKQQTLSTSRSWDVAGIRKTNYTHDVFLTRDGEGFVLETRGRNGELVPRETVSVQVTTSVRSAVVEQTLQSDERGRIDLGKLEGATQLTYMIPGGMRHERDLTLNQVRWPDVIQTTADRPIQLPIVITVDEARGRYRLIELRDGSYQADASQHLEFKDGLLTVGSLRGGDYHLIDRGTGLVNRLVVVEGPDLVSVATGYVRHRELSPAVPLGIASITRDGSGLSIQLSGETQLARVHLYGSRFLEEVSPIDQLYLPLPGLDGRRVVWPRCGYLSDLQLGDEYQYVLRRKYAKKFPGVMLPQPSVILNPWATEDTANQSQLARPGQAVPPSAPSAAAMEAQDAARGGQQRAATTTSDFDFLADPGVILANLRPDENGIVKVPADAITGWPILQIVACDPATMLQRVVTDSLQAAETVDLRLAKSLEADFPYTFERGVSIASKDKPLDLESLGSAQLQIYSSVGDLWKLYKTLVNDSRLTEFDELSVWHTLDNKAKLDAYSRLAGHELHLFLYFHDRSLFDEVVLPYLANKKEKQFVDEWLLNAPLDSYTTLWRYSQLNAAERALMAMRVPGVGDSIRRELQEIVASRDEDYAGIRLGIESALKTKNFDVDAKRENADMYFRKLGEVSEKMVESESFALGEDRAKRQLGRAAGADKAASRRAMPDADGAAFFGGRAGGFGGGGAPFFRNLDSTKQWAESQWDRVRTVGGPAPASLIDVDAFWADLAQQTPETLTVSRYLLRPVENRHAALAALAMCGLPLVAGDVGLPTEGGKDYAPQHAVAVVTKRLQRLQVAEGQASILIGQRFELVNDSESRNRTEQPTEPTEYLTGQAYRGHIVISNPTAQQRVVDVFWQLPAGSLPLAAKRTTDSQTIVLEPFAVQAVTYEFYFPVAGAFVHYPATVASEGKLIAQAEPREFTVVEQLTDQQAVTWERIAEVGDAAQIKGFLQQANLRKIDWILVAHRMKDQAIYQVVVDALRESRLPIAPLWAYGFFHRDEDAMRNFLSLRDDLAQRTGPALNSPLLKVNPIERGFHELLEYSPLVRARIHRLGQEDEILNPTFHQQYESFVRMLGYSAEIADDERLVLTYYLLIQNRIADAIDQFQKVGRDNLSEQLQYDYLDAYLAMHQEQYDRAEQLARRHADHPVPRWSQRFGQVLSQLRQRHDLNQPEKLVSVDAPDKDGVDAQDAGISEDSGDLAVLDRERRQASASDQQPEVIVRIDGDSIRIDHRRAKDVVLNFYGVDLELLFSKAPFVREDLQRMAMVRPSRSESIRFDTPDGTATYELGENLRRQTLLVEVIAGASRSTTLYYGGDMTTYVSESYGQLQTSDAASSRPVSTAYVKVYARYPDGQVRFYKDGYTDARGRFDYASISAADAQGAARFAILVMSDEKGATLHDVAAPNQ
jgi:hypothetical protein